MEVSLQSSSLTSRALEMVNLISQLYIKRNILARNTALISRTITIDQIAWEVLHTRSPLLINQMDNNQCNGTRRRMVRKELCNRSKTSLLINDSSACTTRLVVKELDPLK